MYQVIIIILILILLIYYLNKENKEKKDKFVSIPKDEDDQNIMADVYSIVLSNNTIKPDSITIDGKITQNISASNIVIGNNLSVQKLQGNTIRSNNITSGSLSFIDKNIIITQEICDQNNYCLQQEDIVNLNYITNPKLNRMYFADASNCKIFEKLNYITTGNNNVFSILGSTSGQLTLDTTPSSSSNPFLYNTGKVGYYYSPQQNYDSSVNKGFTVIIPTPAQLGFKPEVLWVEVYNLYNGGKSFQVSDTKDFSVKVGSYLNNYNLINPDGGISTNSNNLNNNSYWFPIPFNYDNIDISKTLYISRHICNPTTFNICGIAFTTNPWNHFPVNALSIYWNLNKDITDSRTTLTSYGFGESTDHSEYSIYLNTYGLSNISNIIVRIPVVNNDKDKVLYLITNNDVGYNLETMKAVYIFTDPDIFNKITSNSSSPINKNTDLTTVDYTGMFKINNFSPSFDNPFARSYNSSTYKRYLATIIPKDKITSNFIIIGLQLPVSKLGTRWSNTRFKEIGTHDLFV